MAKSHRTVGKTASNKSKTNGQHPNGMDIQQVVDVLSLECIQKPASNQTRDDWGL